MGTKQRVQAALAGFTRGTFTDARGVTRDYCRIGDGDQPVMVLHELLGPSPADLDFCRRLAARGFVVYAPIFFGTPGYPRTPLYRLRCVTSICVSREFALFAAHRSSPVTDALRVLGREIYDRHGPPGFAVVGMCLTGNFALAMLADEHLVAPVLAEPALPAAIGPLRGQVGLSDAEIACARERVARGTTILGYRFQNDPLCPVQRFDALSTMFGDGFEGHSITPTRRGAHSVFAEEYDPKPGPTRDAFERLVEYLDARL